MSTVREAFRARRQAHAHRELWMFYLEHNLFDEARKARLRMTELLHRACRQWRAALGMAG